MASEELRNLKLDDGDVDMGENSQLNVIKQLDLSRKPRLSLPILKLFCKSFTLLLTFWQKSKLKFTKLSLL